MNYAIPSWDLPRHSIAGGAELFPVRPHLLRRAQLRRDAKRWAATATKEPPLLHQGRPTPSSPSCRLPSGRSAYPPATRNFPTKSISSSRSAAAGANVATERANALVFGYAVAST